MNTITVPVKVSTDTLTFKVDVSADRAFAVGMDTAIQAIISERYVGPYEVTPRLYEQTLATENLTMLNDVTVYEIPITRTTNPIGGLTVLIG